MTLKESVEGQGAIANRSKFNRISNWLAALIDRYQPPEQVVMITTAIIVGLGTGLGAVVFIRMLEKIGEFTQLVETWVGSIFGLFLMMGVAGLIVGFVIERWATEAKGHGVPEVMEALVLRGGRIRPRVAALKVLASSLTIGTGGSAGREGPIVQVGSALGSTLGQLLHFPNDRVSTLVACGAAAGIAATFNAPIAGAIFALEVILNRFTVRHFGSVVISSVSAAIIGRAFLGDKPAFTVPTFALNSVAELPIYLVLGVLAALVAVLFIRMLYRVEGWFDDWHIPLAFKTSLGMLLTAAVAIILPDRHVLGPGLDLIGDAIGGDFQLTLGLMAALLILKLLATTFTLGSGNSGGVFAPGLFMGAVLGGMVGTIAHGLWPQVAVHPGAYAIVGMAAVFSGAARAPITAVLIVFEMSNDYRLILPLMLATVISTLLAEHLFPWSIYTLKLKLKGITLQLGRDVDVLQGVTVDEIMSPAKTVDANMTVSELVDLLAITHSHGFAVVDKANHFQGVVTVTDVDRALASHIPEDATVKQIATPSDKVQVAYPDETIDVILTRMSVRGLGRLPVLSRENPEDLVGMIRRQDIIKSYNLALTRRAELQHRAKQMKLRNIDGIEFLSYSLEPDDPAVGAQVKELAAKLPDDCILVSIRRDGRVFIPHGKTRFQAGDQVTAFVSNSHVEGVATCLKQHVPPLEVSEAEEA